MILLDINIGNDEIIESVQTLKRSINSDIEECMSQLRELKTLYTETVNELADIENSITNTKRELRLKQSELSRSRDTLDILKTKLREADSELEDFDRLSTSDRHTPREDSFLDTFNSELNEADYAVDCESVLDYFRENGDTLPYMEVVSLFPETAVKILIDRKELEKRGRNLIYTANK